MILCCGEALIDMIPEPTQSGASGFVPHQGGAVLNTAVALGRLGVTTGMLTGLSNDMFGTQLKAALAASNVDTQHCITSTRPTTLAFVTVTDGQARYSFYDENSAGRMITASELPPLSPNVSALFFGGISLACEPGAQAYEALLHAQGTSRVVILDPNIRPAFVEDPAEYRARLTRMMAKADIVKVSDEDLHWLTPGPDVPHTKARALLTQGPGLVILTAGKDGATAFLQDGSEITVPSEPVAVADTVGAGDTFNAGVLAHLSQSGLLTKDRLRNLSQTQVSDALHFGAKVAAITVSRIGANPPWSHDL